MILRNTAIFFFLVNSLIGHSCDALKYENMFSYSVAIDSVDKYCFDCSNAEVKNTILILKGEIDEDLDSLFNEIVRKNDSSLEEFRFMKFYLNERDVKSALRTFYSLAKEIRMNVTEAYADCLGDGTYYGTGWGFQYLSMSYEIKKFLNGSNGKEEFISYYHILRDDGLIYSSDK